MGSTPTCTCIYMYIHVPEAAHFLWKKELSQVSLCCVGMFVVSCAIHHAGACTDSVHVLLNTN